MEKPRPSPSESQMGAKIVSAIKAPISLWIALRASTGADDPV
jgi:hypothetical protein